MFLERGCKEGRETIVRTNGALHELHALTMLDNDPLKLSDIRQGRHDATADTSVEIYVVSGCVRL